MLSRNYFLHNRYRIIRPLGKGGFGQVYEALDDKLDCIVAIKERLAKLDSEKLRRAFEREAKLLANLRHPVLAKVFNHFFEGDGQYLVMEFIEGDDLAVLLSKRQSPFPTLQVLSWADEVLKALGYLHTRSEPIIHRDVKPANLKLSSEGEIFLLDFGLAKGYAGEMATPEASQRSSSVHGYTAAYAPLEQLNNSGTNEQSDIYSLGATLYHLLTGNVPPTSAKRYRNIELGQRDPVLPVHEVNDDVPFPVSLVVAQAMAISRRDRIKSAARMRQSLIEARQEFEARLAEPNRSQSTTVAISARGQQTPEANLPSAVVPMGGPDSRFELKPSGRRQKQIRKQHAQGDDPSLTRDQQLQAANHQEVSWPSQLTSEGEDPKWASTIVDSTLSADDRLETDEATRLQQVALQETTRLAEEERERIAKEERERIAKEERKRLAKEKRQRLAREKQERLEAETALRLAREKEAAQLAKQKALEEEARKRAEQEALRRAAEERELREAEAGANRLREAARFAKQKTLEDDARKRAEQEALRRAAEERELREAEAEVTRLSEEREAARLAKEKTLEDEARKRAEQEALRRAAEERKLREGKAGVIRWTEGRVSRRLAKQNAQEEQAHKRAHSEALRRAADGPTLTKNERVRLLDEASAMHSAQEKAASRVSWTVGFALVLLAILVIVLIIIRFG